MRSALVLLIFFGCKGGSSEKAEPAPASAAGPAKLDACTLLNQKDAEALFGHPANRHQGATTPDPALLGDCSWDYDAPDHSSQLLQVNIWTGSYYDHVTKGAGAQLDVGDKGTGTIVVSDAQGIDIAFVQKGRFVQLGYFATGPTAPKASAKVDQMKALANKLSGAL